MQLETPQDPFWIHLIKLLALCPGKHLTRLLRELDKCNAGFRVSEQQESIPILEHLLPNRKSSKPTGVWKPQEAVACPITPLQPAWCKVTCPQELLGPHFLYTIFLHVEDAGRKAENARWKLSQRCAESSSLCYSLPTTSMCALESACFWLQAACCVLARLLAPWCGSPGQHNVTFLCQGWRYGAVWQKDSTLGSCFLLRLRSPEYSGH